MGINQKNPSRINVQLTVSTRCPHEKTEGIFPQDLVLRVRMTMALIRMKFLALDHDDDGEDM